MTSKCLDFKPFRPYPMGKSISVFQDLRGRGAATLNRSVCVILRDRMSITVQYVGEFIDKKRTIQPTFAFG